MTRRIRRFRGNDSGAVAPTVALSLFALIGAGGIAFDYARLASLDTELQNAADQAALAAATQLDKQPGAIARATAAANNLVTNQTLFANDGGTSGIGGLTLTFCSAFDDTKADTAAACTVTTSDATARSVWVQIGGRTANFALTPVVGALSSGTIEAEAVAGQSSAICKEPPMMLCNPAGAGYDINKLVGRGIALKATGGGGAWAPGDFGFLDVGAGAADLAKVMGWSTSTFECVDVTNPSTETGGLTSVINEYNTRFDLYESGDSIGCFGQSKCAPSLNSRKDVVIDHGAPYTKANCGIASGAGSKGWRTTTGAYRPSDSNILPVATAPDAMGYPHDQCHAFNDPTIPGNPNCTSVATWGALKASSSERIGTGDWDIDAYWRTNHNAAAMANGGLYPTSMNSTIMAAAPLPAGVTRSYPTRYQVYRWEMANAATALPAAGRPVGTSTDYGQPICQPGLAASTPAGTNPDRRVIPVSVINCTGLSGKKPVNPLDTVDVFLTEPSIDRITGSGPTKKNWTKLGDIYVEIIGHTGQGTGQTANQFVRRDKPYLIR
jgi:Flp pilus assembly protein TadG